MQNHYDDLGCLFIVTFTEAGSEVEREYGLWADDAVEASEKTESRYPDLNCIVHVETDEEYEARTGFKWDRT